MKDEIDKEFRKAKDAITQCREQALFLSMEEDFHSECHEEIARLRKQIRHQEEMLQAMHNLLWDRKARAKK